MTRQAGIRDVCRDKLHKEGGAARSAYALNTCWEWIFPLDSTAQSWSAAAMSQSSPWGGEDMGTHCAHMENSNAIRTESAIVEALFIPQDSTARVTV